MVEAALSPEGAANPKNVFTYRLLGGLGSHDLSAMRELLGVPKRCFAASRAQAEGMPFITALFDYGGFTATYESGIDNVADFDAHIEVIGDGKRVKISYDTVRLSLASVYRLPRLTRFARHSLTSRVFPSPSRRVVLTLRAEMYGLLILPLLAGQGAGLTRPLRRAHDPPDLQGRLHDRAREPARVAYRGQAGQDVAKRRCAGLDHL